MLHRATGRGAQCRVGISRHRLAGLVSHGHAPLARHAHAGLVTDADGAIADLGQLIRLNPNSYYAYADRGLAHRDKGEPSLAIADFSEAIRLLPTYGDLYFQRGLAYRTMGDTERAVADFKQAIEVDPLGSKASRDALKSLVGEAEMPRRKSVLEMIK